MVDFICTSPRVAKILQDSVQWQLLLKHLERNGIGANVWVDGEEQPIAVQIPELPDIPRAVELEVSALAESEDAVAAGLS